MICPVCGAEWQERVERPVKCPRCWYQLVRPVRERRVPRMVEESGRTEASSAQNPAVLDKVAKGVPRAPETAAEAGQMERQTPAPVNSFTGDDEGIFDPDHPGMADEVANVRERLQLEMCPNKWADTQKGEWVHCALSVHSPKVKCQPGRRESYLEDG